MLGSQFSATVCELNCPPAPVSAIVKPPALLATVIAPAMLPVDAGVNVTFRAALCPCAKVVLAPTPVTEKPAPLAATLEIVTLVFPVFVNVTPRELLLPTRMLPKSRLLVFAVRDAVDAMPLPLAVIDSGELGALLTSAIEPDALPAELGVNTTLNVVLCPAAILMGTARPDVLNPAPDTLALEIVAVAVPAFCKVIVCELLEPIATEEKLAAAGIAASCGWGGFVEGCGVPVAGWPLFPEFTPATIPAQPLAINAAAAATPKKHHDIFCNSDLTLPMLQSV